MTSNTARRLERQLEVLTDPALLPDEPVERAAWARREALVRWTSRDTEALHRVVTLIETSSRAGSWHSPAYDCEAAARRRAWRLNSHHGSSP